MSAVTRGCPLLQHYNNWYFWEEPNTQRDYWIIILIQCYYMIWPPGSLSTPTSCFSGEVLRVGPSCLIYYPVPYIPSPLVPAGDLRREEQCCHAWMVLRMPYVDWTTAAKVHRSLGYIVERLSARVDCPVLHISCSHLAEMGVYGESGEHLDTRLNWEFFLVASLRDTSSPSKPQFSRCTSWCLNGFISGPV